MERRALNSEHAPKAIGPYSQANIFGRFVFLSGQIPIDHVTGEFVAGSIKAQTRQVLRNLTRVLEEAGLGLKDVAKTTVYLTDMSDFTEMNEVYAEFFSAPFPARATVAVSALPKGALVEIDAIAVTGDD